eukprot:TRINITY_DN1641_c0_g1_i1.p1 TRINITY_DN1641_c0_g1~~TRINITY_DN1641_c0_g1_i1.p1  ORF type:complete len:175 (+),score=39.34 TRINITY_DN1641_c0_g1_i1:244-768(+)
MKGSPWSDLMRATEACIEKRISYSQGSQSTESSKDKVTIVNYSSTAEVMCSDVLITDQPHKKIVFRGGGTNFGAGLSLVRKQMKKMKGKYVPVLLFMSDGGCANGEVEIKQIAEEIKDVQIFVIGFGNNCCQSKMQNMAAISGGQYHFGVDGVNLVSVFETISEELSTTTFALS